MISMVFPDLSASPKSSNGVPEAPRFPIASMSDRWIALVLDFLIFSPVIGLFIAGLMRQARTYFLLDTRSTEGIVVLLLAAAVILVLIVLLQTVFLFYWQATPGQLFLQLEVRSYPHEQKRLGLNQCLLRSVLWCTGWTVLALPFLEIVSHPLRRAFHERASDTMVVTRKGIADDGPMPLETKFISSWMRMSFLLLALFAVLGFFKIHHSLLAGEFSPKIKESVPSCKQMTASMEVGASRLDQAISLFLLDELSSDCLDQEANASLWEDPVGAQDMAYLAKFLTSEPGDQEKYLDEICENKSTSCMLAKYMSEGGRLADLEKADAKLWTTQLLMSDEQYSLGRFTKSLQIIDDLQKSSPLKLALEKRYVRNIWALSQNQSGLSPNQSPNQNQTQKGRSPASQDSRSSGPWLEIFKERYDIK